MKRKLLLLASSLFVYLQAHAQQDYNLGFEHWDSTSLVNDTLIYNLSPGMHKIPHPYHGQLSYGWSAALYGITRTTDAHSGRYAAVLHQWYNYSPSWAIMGNCARSQNTDTCQLSIPGKLYGLSGYFKYFNDNSNTGRARLLISTYHTDTITHASVLLTRDSLLFTPADRYTYFNLPVHYTDTSARPDSMAVQFNITGPSCNNGPYCYFLYLDDLALHYTPYSTAVKETGDLKKKVKIYPNPAIDKLYLEYTGIVVQSIRLTKPNGALVYTFPRHSTQLDIHTFPAGNYLLEIKTREGKLVEKIIIP